MIKAIQSIRHLIKNGIVDDLLDIGADIHIDQFRIILVRIDLVGKEDVQDTRIGISPYQRARKARMPETVG